MPRLMNARRTRGLLCILTVAFMAWGTHLAVAQPEGSAAPSPVPSVEMAPPPMPTAPAAPRVAESAEAPESAGGVTVRGASVSNDYVLRPGDSIQVTVFREAELATRTRISADGSIIFPLLGEVKIGGTSVKAAREKVRSLLEADYLVDPQVTLAVIEYGKRSFTVLGQVEKPGNYDLPADSKLSLMQAVGLAGGYKRSADIGKITVRRNAPSGPDTIKLNVKRLDDAGASFYIHEGDVVTVPESWF